MDTKKSPTLDMFQQWKDGDACLSQRQIVMFACGDAAPNEGNQTHLQSCDSCAFALQEEETAMRAAAYIAIPADLREKFAAPEPRRNWLTGAAWGVMGLCAATLLAVFLPASNSSLDGSAATTIAAQTKGNASLVFSVMRSGHLIADEVPAETLGALQDGDRLRIRVIGTDAGAQTTLQGWEGDHWQNYFSDALPTDRWLPTGVRFNNKGESRLRLKTCNLSGACTEHVYELH